MKSQILSGAKISRETANMQEQLSNSKSDLPSSSDSNHNNDERPGSPEQSTKEPSAARPKSRLMKRAGAKYEAQQIRLRTRQLTFSLLTFVGAISSLSPFLSLHLTNQIGFLLFESDVLQLRASLITVIVCLSALVILGIIIIIANKTCPPFQALDVRGGNESSPDLDRATRRRSLLLQKVLKRSAGTLATISILLYLSLALLVQNIHQTQRLPFATFDCNANLIIIENCQQQFPTSTSKPNSDHNAASILFDSVPQLFSDNLDGNNERLANRLECLKYNDESLQRLRAPTRFLLSNCGLVCKAHRQQLHQFGDDLNSDQSEADHRVVGDGGRPTSTRTAQLIAPYSQPDYQDLNATRSIDHDSELRGNQDDNQDANHLVSLKLCFSGELDGTNSNYKRFCIENLTGGGLVTQTTRLNSFSSSQARGNQLDQTLTVGQLNAILSKVQIERAAPSDKQQFDRQESGPISVANSRSSAPTSVLLDQSTHYVNPIVQFESHFKNWPHLTRASVPVGDQRSGSSFFSDKHFQAANTRPHADWCKFKPIPPFIVNNKPFSDIHCSLESDYLMSTSNLHPSGMSQRYRRQPRAATPRIYLKKSVVSNGNYESTSSGDHRERCNIQCKVNILYQVSVKTLDSENKQSNSYYLPMKYCLIVSSYSDKLRAHWSYMMFRSLADASILLAFILIDAQLLIESRDTKQFQFEGRKVRLIGLLLALVLPPLLAGLLFDLSATFSQKYPQIYHDNHWFIRWCNEHLLPWLNSLWYRMGTRYNPEEVSKAQTLSNASDFIIQSSSKMKQEFVVGKYLIPFVVYAVLMFAFALSTFKTPLVFLAPSLVGMTSTEELGLADGTDNEKQTANKREKGSTKDKALDDLRGKFSSLRRSITPINSDRSFKEERAKRNPSERRDLIKFAMLTLFMGLQFNLSQLTQSQILFDSFNIQNDLTLQQQAKAINLEQANAKVATWLVLISSSGGAFTMLLIALLFSNELSHFLNEFYPFKRLPKVHNKSSKLQNSAKFNKFLASSLIIYSFRYFVLANITPQANRLKWPLVILFQTTELLNFPLTWFVLTSRAHELLVDWGQHQISRRRAEGAEAIEETRPEIPSNPASLSMSLHLVIQATMAFIYFALARFMALFTHSLHASLYLHSDNIDWFIDRHHDGQMVSNRTASRSSGPLNDSIEPIESLFMPLPSERQTYLHASRLFVKYNSLVCLILGLVLGGLFAAHKFQVYLENLRLKRACRRGRTSPPGQDSELIDERLSLDLAEIHSRSRKESQRHDSVPTLTRHIPGSSHAQFGSTTDESGTSGLARAQVHLRYGFGRTRRPSTSSSSSGSYSLDPNRNLHDHQRRLQAQHGIDLTDREAWRQMPQANSQFGQTRVKELDSTVEDDQMSYQAQGKQRHSDSDEDESIEEEIKQISRRRTIRIVEDEEIWSDDEEGDVADGVARTTDLLEQRSQNISPGEAQRVLELSMAMSPPPVEFADNYELYMPPPEEFVEHKPQAGPLLFRSIEMQRSDLGLKLVPSSSERQRKRQITFSPTTTFIDQDGGESIRVQGESGSEQSALAARDGEDSQIAELNTRFKTISNGQRSQSIMASPEPSIDDDEDDY